MSSAARRLALILGLVLLAADGLRAQTPWRVLEAEVSFQIRNAGLPVRGTFDLIEASIDFDPAAPASAEIEATVDPATIRTGIELRDRHLTGRQFFDVRRFPVISMRSVDVVPGEEEGTFDAVFDLTLRDVTRRVPVHFEVEEGGNGASISGELTIDRVDFGVGDGGFVLGDEVIIRVRVAVTR